MDWLVIGLGNPGHEYNGTRHNLGFLVVEAFRKCERLTSFSSHGDWESTSGRVGERTVSLVKPQTFMNRSGDILTGLMRRYPVDSPDGLVVVHDDLDFPLGRIKIQKRSGAGGHKGVASIITSLDSKSFTRLRIGIGRPQLREVVGHVLEAFSPHEREQAELVIKHAAAALSMMVRRGVVAAMNRYNGMVFDVPTASET